MLTSTSVGDEGGLCSALMLMLTCIVAVVHGRYGLLGPNGCGKSILMTVLGRRMVPIPESIDSFHVVAEVRVFTSVGTLFDKTSRLKQQT